MNILIVTATELEVNPLLLQFTFRQEIYPELINYSYKNHQIDVLVTGVGMTSTAFLMGKTLNTKEYDIAINLGIAGSFNDNIKIGETVHIISDEIAELGAEDDNQFLSLKDMKLSKFESGYKNITPINNSIISSLKKVNGITVNTVHGNEKSIEKIKNRLNPDIESMEGAAFFHACLSENTLCAQIRTISNKVEKRNRDSWDIPLAINNLCKTGLEIINNL
jgi:futalosine hydrolase